MLTTMRRFGQLALRVMVLGIVAPPVALAAPAGIRTALDENRLGLYQGKDFRLVEGQCADCVTVPQALWYFRDDLIAVPQSLPAGYTRNARAQDDVRAWAREHRRGDGSRPPLLWVGSPAVADGMRLEDGGRTMVARDGSRIPFSVVPKIETTLSYYDASSVQHLAERPLRMRGRMVGDGFVARTLS